MKLQFRFEREATEQGLDPSSLESIGLGTSSLESFSDMPAAWRGHSQNPNLLLDTLSP